MPRDTLHCIVAAVASLQEVLHSNSASASYTLTSRHFSRRKRQFYTSERYLLSALCVTSLSLTLILFHFFCDEQYIAQEILFKLVMAQKTQREGRESERGLFLTEAISQRSPLARLRNLWVWLKVKRQRMKLSLSFDFVLTHV